MLEQIQVRKARMSQQIIEAESEISRQNERYEEYQKELKEVSEHIRVLTEENQQYEQKIQEIQKTLAAQTEKFRIGQTAYHREQSRLESLKNITERYDGYGNSIRRVMDNKAREKGLLGVVADIIKVNKEYEIAVETA